MSWVRVRKDMPCPICGRPDWCLVASEGEVALCQRVESHFPRGDAGYFHRLTKSVSVSRRSVKIKSDSVCAAEITILAEQYRQAMTSERYRSLSESLNVSESSLRRLSVGFDGRAFTFPMWNAEGQIIGIRRRFSNGKKVCVKGSQNGLFIPEGLSGEGTLLIVEGNTDCATGLDLDFDTIGRPTCNGGTNLIRGYIRRHRYHRLVIIPDNDKKVDGSNPGLSGGYRLADVLRLYCPDIRVIVPPEEYNDLRCWAHLSLTREELAERIDSSPRINMEVDV